MLSWMSVISGPTSDVVRARRKICLACSTFDLLISQRGLSGKRHIANDQSDGWNRREAEHISPSVDAGKRIVHQVGNHDAAGNRQHVDCH